jgi:tetratricopeptide (TPR) repeat protein
MLTIESLRDALALLAPVCEGYERSAVPANRVARCWVEVGLLELDLDRPDDAQQAFLRISRAYPTPALAAAYIALFGRREPAEATRLLAATASAAAAPPGPAEPWWERASRAELSLALGRALYAQGRLRESRAPLATAASLFAAIVKLHPGAQRERLLGRARVQLGFVLASLHAEPAEIAAVAKPAVAWLQQVGGSPAQIAELSRYLEGGGLPETR